MPNRSSNEDKDIQTVKVRVIKNDEGIIREPQIVKVQTWREITPSDISRVMAEMGRKGGLVGGHARADKLSKRKRIAIAKKAATARWNKSKKDV